MPLRRGIEDLWFGKTAWQGRLKAAAFRRARRGAPPPSDDPLVVFAIPLVSRRRAADWARVEQNLADTLGAFRRQSDPRWIAVICGQDAPTLPDDARIRFLPIALRDMFYDKGHKRRRLVDHVASTLGHDGYYMQFDADDVLHPGAVAHMRADHNGRGYIIRQGYFVSLSCGFVAPMERFDQSCGSCGAVYVDFRHRRTHRRLLMALRSHTKIAQTCAEYGQPLAPMPFPAALYVTGHGENMIARRGRIAERTRSRMRQALSQTEARGVCTEFGLDPGVVTDRPHG